MICAWRISLRVHLRIPDLPNEAVRDEMEAEDTLIKSGRQTPALHRLEFRKASPDDPKHPGWPAGTPEGQGGKFRPKDGSQFALSQKIKDSITRRELKMNLTAALHVGVETLANLIPGVDVPADVAMVAEIARTITEYRQLAIDTAVAFDFVQNAPYSLEDFQVSGDYREFSSYGGFTKGQVSSELFGKWAGPAGDGSQYHHLVTQGGTNANNIPQERLQNTDNIVIIPTLLHEMVSDEYLKPSPVDASMTLYQWLQTQPYDVQREMGLNILRELHILK
jgi:hypothetical protein